MTQILSEIRQATSLLMAATPDAVEQAELALRRALATITAGFALPQPVLVELRACRQVVGAANEYWEARRAAGIVAAPVEDRTTSRQDWLG